jgi:glutathione S-transferase
VRRLACAELLPRCPELAKPALFGKASGSHRLIGNVMWPLSRRVMMRMHGITPDAAAESRSILESELDWLDNTLAGNRRYLSGDRFSRADITVASLLAFFAPPREMPTYCEMPIPGALRADRERWRDRPVMRWVVAQYQTHRLSKPAAG